MITNTSQTEKAQKIHNRARRPCMECRQLRPLSEFSSERPVCNKCSRDAWRAWSKSHSKRNPRKRPEASILLYGTKEQCDQIRAAARASGLSTAEFIRRAATKAALIALDNIA